MISQVVDSSVVFKWFRQEHDELHVPVAVAILEKHLQADLDVCVPDLLFYEIGNVLKNKKDLTTESTEQILEDLFNIGFTVYCIDLPFAQMAFRVAADFDVTFYDACFVALAQELDCDFITADKKLYDAVKELLAVHLLSEL